VRVSILLCLRFLCVPERGVVVLFSWWVGGGDVITQNKVQVLTTLQLSDTPPSYL
jgi:hypothetical protein